MSVTSKLIGHKTLFNNLIYLDQIQKFPNKILINGPKGTGKKILINHFLNYFYSKNNHKMYDLKKNEYKLNNNLSKIISNNSHPNIFKIKKKKDKKMIDIDQIREMIQFTNQTSFNNDRKIIIIEDINLLGIYSANALLKSIEEPNNKIYYILINNSEFKILETIKSRCLEFKSNLLNSEVIEIVNYYFNSDIYKDINLDFINNYNSPSFLISLVNFLENNDLSIKECKIEDLLIYIIKNKSYTSDEFIKEHLNLFIELFFYKNINNSKKISFKIKKYFYIKLSFVKKYNLDFESFFLEFNDKLLSE
ncbi:DNA polymerase III [Candidatus Pelagibacter sp.]|nr:DNA polymerase III [Candidatus Pelagibacter sp.]